MEKVFSAQVTSVLICMSERVCVLRMVMVWVGGWQGRGGEVGKGMLFYKVAGFPTNRKACQYFSRITMNSFVLREAARV